MRSIFGRALLAVSCALIFCSVGQIGQCNLLSGIYVDNGMGQTVPHRVASRRERREVARGILEALRLPSSRGRRRASNATDVSAARYIYELYNGGRHVDKLADESDIVVGYAIDPTRAGDMIGFDLSTTPPEVDLVIGAKLRIHRRAWPGRSVVAVYEKPTSRKKKTRKQLRPMYTSSSGEWIDLDATEVLRRHLPSRRVLELSIAVVSDNGTASRAEWTDVEESKRPFLVGYFAADAEPIASRSSPRWKRSSFNGNPYVSKYSRQHGGSRSRRPTIGSCRKHSLYVDFAQLEFDRLIVAPEGYDAQFCAGECRFPLNGHDNASNHAIVQTLVQFLEPGKVPRACCVPTELEPLPVLYSLDGRSHVLKKYRDMVIKNCGCL